MAFSDTSTKFHNNDYISESYNFFPLTQLQVGKWLSAFHAENQIFIYQPSEDLLVFLALHREGESSVTSPYLLTYTRKELLKMCKNSPFTTPVAKKQTCQGKASLLNTKIKIPSAEYEGIVAFEINLNQIDGLDYSNTLHTYGSRISLEVKKAKKLWFYNTKEFCKYYNIDQGKIVTKYYNPVLNKSKSLFKPKKVDPRKINSKLNLFSEEFNIEYLQTTPDVSKRHFKPRRSLSQTFDWEPSKSSQKENPYLSKFHESEYLHFTIAAYFDDPIFPYFVKKLLKNPRYKSLLTMYERGIPSWAQFLPSYGLPYRPWMRRVMAVVIFIFSLITMLLGFYDLYKNIPQLREFLSSTFGNFFIMFEEAIILRLSVLLGYLIASSQSFQYFLLNTLACTDFFKGILEICTTGINAVIDVITQSIGPFAMIFALVRMVKDLLVGLVLDLGSVLASILHLKQVVFLVFQGVFELLYLVYSMVALFGKEVKDLAMLALSLPFEIIYGVTYGVFDVFYEIFSDFYFFFSSLVKAFRYITAAFKNNQNGLSVSESLNIFESIRNFWFDIFRHIISGTTRIYHFIVYTSCNIYKHKDSMWVYWENNSLKILNAITAKIRNYKFWILLYILVLLYVKMKQYSITKLISEL